MTLKTPYPQLWYKTFRKVETEGGFQRERCAVSHPSREGDSEGRLLQCS